MDGLVERFNQTLKATLRKVADSEGKDWDKLLPYILFVYREVPQALTRFSPFDFICDTILSIPVPSDAIRSQRCTANFPAPDGSGRSPGD